MFDFFTNWLEPCAYLLSLIILLTYYANERTFRIKILIYFNLLATILMTVASSWVKYDKANGVFYNALVLISLVALGSYFNEILMARTPRIIIKYCMAAGTLYFLMRAFWMRKIDVFDSTGASAVTVVIIALSFAYFHQLLRHVNERKITLSIDFWIVSGLLLYYLGRFFIIQTYEYLTKKIMPTNIREERRIMTLLWAVPNAFLFITALLLLTGTLWISYRKKYRS